MASSHTWGHDFDSLPGLTGNQLQGVQAVQGLPSCAAWLVMGPSCKRLLQGEHASTPVALLQSKLVPTSVPRLQGEASHLRLAAATSVVLYSRDCLPACLGPLTGVSTLSKCCSSSFMYTGCPSLHGKVKESR